MKIRTLIPLLVVLACSNDKETSGDEASKGKAATKIAVQDTTGKETIPAKKSMEPPATKTPEAGAPTVPTVTEFISKESKFSVMSSRKPDSQTLEVPTALGTVPATQYSFHAKGAPGAIGVLVMTMPIPEDTKDAVLLKALEDARDGAVNQFNGKIVSDKASKIGDVNARNFEFTANHPDLGPLVARCRYLMRKNVMYQVMRLSGPSASAIMAEGDALLESFKLTE